MTASPIATAVAAVPALARPVGDHQEVAVADGSRRRYVCLDAAASTAALPNVAERVAEFLPWYSSVHRGAGVKSRVSTDAYEAARHAALTFAGRDGDDIAVICRNTTDAINHLAYRLQLSRSDVVVTTVVEHHANLLPWSRFATCRYVECDDNGMFGAADVAAALDQYPRPRLLAVTGASNVTGWLPPLDDIVAAAHERDVPVLVDAAQLAPHRPLPPNADYIAWSGHKMYAPFGVGVLVGPRATFADGDPFLHGGGAVDLVGLDEVLWTQAPEREEAGSPNVVGAVALHAAMDEMDALGWDAIVEHETTLAEQLRTGLAEIPGVRLLGPPPGTPTLAIGAFTVEESPPALVAARLSAEFAIGVRHGCFCAHPYIMRLLDLCDGDTERYRRDVLTGDRRNLPGAVRASAGLGTTSQDIDDLLDAVRTIAGDATAPLNYHQDVETGDFHWT